MNIADLIKEKLDKKPKAKSALLVVAKKEPADEALTSAMEDLISAIKDDNAELAAKAIKAAVDICQSCTDEEEEPSEEE